jgi:hypothetical protein
MDRIENKSISEAAISVRTEWIQGIPNYNDIPPINLPFTVFPTTIDKDGIFRKLINAPDVPGYYRLIVMVETTLSGPETLEEIFLVEPVGLNWIH